MRNEEHGRIWEVWHQASVNRNQPALLALYAEDAILESPYIPVVLDQIVGIVKGHDQIKFFLDQAAIKSVYLMKPNAAMLWWREAHWFSAGRTLMWEYPRQTPKGEQIDALEVMDIDGGLIRHHRVYWGWKTFSVTARP